MLTSPMGKRRTSKKERDRILREKEARQKEKARAGGRAKTKLKPKEDGGCDATFPSPQKSLGPHPPLLRYCSLWPGVPIWVSTRMQSWPRTSRYLVRQTDGRWTGGRERSHILTS